MLQKIKYTVCVWGGGHKSISRRTRHCLKGLKAAKQHLLSRHKVNEYDQGSRANSTKTSLTNVNIVKQYFKAYCWAVEIKIMSALLTYPQDKIKKRIQNVNFQF